MSQGNLTRRGVVERAAIIGSAALAGCLDDEPTRGSEGDEREETPADTNATEDEDGSGGKAEPDEDDTTDDADATDETEPEDVSFQSADGVELMGTVYGDGDCGVVLTPQINLERGSWGPQATQLAEQGYLAFAIDVDEDDRPASILGALRYLEEGHGIDRVVFVGASIGGEASVIANARADAEVVGGVVAISPGGGTDYAADLTGRKLFVVAEGDDDRFVETTETLHEEASKPKELQIYDGSAHGQALFDNEHGDDLVRWIAALVEDAASRRVARLQVLTGNPLRSAFRGGGFIILHCGRSRGIRGNREKTT